MPPEFVDVMLCEKMGWSYDEMENTPQFFIERILAKWNAESEHQKREDEKLKRQMKTKTASSRPIRKH